PDPFWPQLYCSPRRDRWETTGNYCATQLRRHPDGTVDGDTIFVKTDCDTRMPRPMEEQDEAYRREGVALPRTTQMDMADTFAKQADGVMKTQNHVNCAGGGPDPGRLAKCRALSAAQASWAYLSDDRDGSLLPSAEKGYKHWHGDFPYGTNDPDCSYYV